MNDLPSFEKVVELYEPLIKKYLSKYHLVYDYEEYQQIARIALWEAYTHYDPEKGPFPAFASITVRGHLLTEIKKRKKYTDVHAPTENMQDIFAIKTDEDNLAGLDLTYVQLSSRERLWVEAAIFQDQSTKEIAAAYGVTQDTVRSWKKSAIRKLKRYWRR